jgi:GNAT superfamily N-acetyltransferase
MSLKCPAGGPAEIRSTVSQVPAVSCSYDLRAQVFHSIQQHVSIIRSCVIMLHKWHMLEIRTYGRCLYCYFETPQERLAMTTPPTAATGPVTVRRLQKEDADGVRELDASILGQDRSTTWAEYVDRFLAYSRLGTHSLPWSGSQVAEINGKIVGFLLAERHSSGYGLPPGVRVVALAVHPSHRKHGIGRKLVEGLKADTRRQEMRHIYSVLQAKDSRDAQFLERCGFAPAPISVLVLEA